MGILSQVKSALMRSSNQDPQTRRELAAIKSEGRLHVRAQAPEAVGAYTQLSADGPRSQLVNFSYGGMAVAASTAINIPAKDQELSVSVGILDQAQSFRVKLIRVSSLSPEANLLVFVFIHDQPAGLLFLRRYIEPILEGGSLILIPAEVRNDRYKAPEWLCFRGDRSSELIIKKASSDSQIADLLLIFANQDGYRQLLYQDGNITTGMIDGPSDSLDLGTGSVRSTSKPDTSIIRSAICLLASAPPSLTTLLPPLISQLRTMLAHQS